MKLIIDEPLENATLKEEGQFFDARQLAEWITTLQPRFGDVWVFQAWNMAYNISVTMPETQPHLRWQWVRNGYELLRDKGINANPKDIQLYHELARIFQHKIGGVSDNVHKYYKLQMALELGPLLDAADDQYFENLVEAGRWLWADKKKPDFNEIWKRIAAEPNFAPLVEVLRDADETFAYDQGFIANYLTLRRDARGFAPAAAEVIDDFRENPVLEEFDILAKAYHLRKAWKLEPLLMRRLNKTYGPVDWNDPNKHLPLDWRHADTHAIFWAEKGLETAKLAAEGEEVSGPETNTDRIVVHSLQNLFRNGRLFIHAARVEVPSEDVSKPPQIRIVPEVYLRPDLRMFEPYNDAIVRIIEKYRKAQDVDAVSSLGNGHRNMLINALLSFYQSGHKKYARKILEMLREFYPLPEFDVPLVEYARTRMLKELQDIGIHDAKEQIVAMLRSSYYLYAIRDDNAAFGMEELAKQLHAHYRAVHDDPIQRIDLPELRLLKYFAIEDFFADQQFSNYLKNSLLARIEIERPDFLKQLEQMRRQRIEEQQQTPQI
ncbi:MAG: hypothetical protein ACYS8Z_16280 [Planctomycetota bacterium]